MKLFKYVGLLVFGAAAIAILIGNPPYLEMQMLQIIGLLMLIAAGVNND